MSAQPTKHSLESQQDFTADYACAVEQVRAANPEAGADIPSLPDMKGLIEESLDDTPVFADFEAFFNWWDVLTTYEQWDFDESASEYKPILAVAYRALVAEGQITEPA